MSLSDWPGDYRFLRFAKAFLCTYPQGGRAELTLITTGFWGVLRKQEIVLAGGRNRCELGVCEALRTALFHSVLHTCGERKKDSQATPGSPERVDPGALTAVYYSAAAQHGHFYVWSTVE
jgi:hypothetical protein